MTTSDYEMRYRIREIAVIALLVDKLDHLTLDLQPEELSADIFVSQEQTLHFLLV
jgi:hypothetical protein